MTPENRDIPALADAVADGSAIDWTAVESRVLNPHERIVIEQMRRLAALSAAARTQLSTWGTLEIRAELGRGTFGTVYRAWDPQLQREVALKLLSPQAVEHDALRIIKEARLIVRIRHPNVVTVYGADIHDECVGVFMELIIGRTLRQIVEEQGPFGAHETALIGRDICRALAAVHGQGVLHRDVKAQNVMREAGGRTVLMDFGAGEDLYESTEFTSLAGTPAYCAPEVLAGRPASPQSDLYSLGVLLYFLASGHFPVTGDSVAEIETQHSKDAHTPLLDARPDLPASFVSLVERALAVNPADRPASAGAMEKMLESSLRHDRVTALRFWRWPSAVAFAGLIGLLGVSLFGVPLWPHRTNDTLRSSVAVLPFKSVSTGTNDDYFSAGITREVVSRLTTLHDLQVIAGASTLHYKAEKRSPTEIARELGVAAILDGSVERSGNRVRIETQLIDGITGRPLWTESFERELNDIFALQSEVSRKIAIALKGELSPADVDRLRPRAGRDFEAFNLYLEGRSAWALRTQDGIQRGIQLFEQAIQRDPTYAPPYSGLADAYTTLGGYGLLPRSEAFARAAAAAEKAVALDQSLAEAHASLAYAQKNRFQWAAAEASFKRALELNPGSASTHHWYSIYLTQRGRFPEAITEIKAAIALDPLSVGANLQFASALRMARRYEDAISQWRLALEMDSSFVNAYRGIASSYTDLGLYDKAFDAVKEAERHSAVGAEDQELKADLGYLMAKAGRRAEALSIIRDLKNRYFNAGEQVAGSVAGIYSGLGQIDTAFEWLNRAKDAHDPEVGFLKVDPRWDALRGDPRFNALLASLGLID